MTGHPVEILLVEDTPNDAELTIRALHRDNISNHIQVARDGAEAVEFLFSTAHDHDGSPKLILLDLRLPKIDGIEVLRRIREDSRIRDIPVVVLTSSQADRDLQACQELGVSSYIVKPVDFQKLTDAVRNLGFYCNTMGLYWALFSHNPS